MNDKKNKTDAQRSVNHQRLLRLKAFGITYFIRNTMRYFSHDRGIKGFGKFRHLFENKSGAEIGGPSDIFQPLRALPIYPIASKIDDINYSEKIIWVKDREINECEALKMGKRIIAEATKLSVENGTYDFILSSHMIEHAANPIKVLHEQRRVLKDGGTLVVVAPYAKYTFDHNREVTPLSHMMKDYDNDISEDDETHFGEVLSKTDLALYNMGHEGLKERTMNNKVYRAAHHHVFDEENLGGLVEAAGFEAVHVEIVLPYHLVVIAKKKSEL
jgi:SAM-dependent methyltransferase